MYIYCIYTVNTMYYPVNAVYMNSMDICIFYCGCLRRKAFISHFDLGLICAENIVDNFTQLFSKSSSASGRKTQNFGQMQSAFDGQTVRGSYYHRKGKLILYINIFVSKKKKITR